MEALFSDFHVGDVGVGVVGSRRGHQSGRLVVSWMWGVQGVGCWLPELRNEKIPANRCLQGVGDGVEVGGGDVAVSSAAWVCCERGGVVWSVYCCQST
jgi:hypothetical protein